MDIETFTKRAKTRHGCRYDYSKTTYNSELKKFLINCRTHGEFLISSNHHLNRGQGCRDCGLKVATSDDIFTQAKNIHGDHYDYSKSVFKSFHEKMLVMCPEHGEFSITPTKHLHSKQGCNQCGIKKVSSIKNDRGRSLFKGKLKAIHGDSYDYSEIKYTCSKELVVVICRKHGRFKIKAEKLLQGNGCKKCGNESASLKRALSQEEFIARAQIVHGNKFDYSKTKYTTSNKKVIITCRVHGDFSQYPLNHLKGCECGECGFAATGNFFRKPLEEFISQACSIHSNRYNYSKVDYINTKTDVEIVCPEHGIFQQNPTNHLKGSGCPLCVKVWHSKGVRSIEDWLRKKNIQFEREKTFKELRSSKQKNQRLRFDFFLPNKNIFIEYDGEQHFKAVKIWGGEKTYKELIANDELKNLWAIENGYRMIRISFKDLEKVEEILSETVMLEESLKI